MSIEACPITVGHSLAEIDSCSMAITPGSMFTNHQLSIEQAPLMTHSSMYPLEQAMMLATSRPGAPTNLQHKYSADTPGIDTVNSFRQPRILRILHKFGMGQRDQVLTSLFLAHRMMFFQSDSIPPSLCMMYSATCLLITSSSALGRWSLCMTGRRVVAGLNKISEIVVCQKTHTREGWHECPLSKGRLGVESLWTSSKAPTPPSTHQSPWPGWAICTPVAFLCLGRFSPDMRYWSHPLKVRMPLASSFFLLLVFFFILLLLT